MSDTSKYQREDLNSWKNLKANSQANYQANVQLQKFINRCNRNTHEELNIFWT